MKYFLLVLFSFFATNAISAPTWYNDLTVVSAGYYWDGSRDVWEVIWEEKLTTGCAISDSQNKASWTYTGGTDIFVIGNSRLAPALSALSTGKKVDLLMDPTTCDNSLGAAWHGTKAHN